MLTEYLHTCASQLKFGNFPYLDDQLKLCKIKQCEANWFKNCKMYISSYFHFQLEVLLFNILSLLKIYGIIFWWWGVVTRENPQKSFLIWISAIFYSSKRFGNFIILLLSLSLSLSLSHTHTPTLIFPPKKARCNIFLKLHSNASLAISWTHTSLSLSLVLSLSLIFFTLCSSRKYKIPLSKTLRINFRHDFRSEIIIAIYLL